MNVFIPSSYHGRVRALIHIIITKSTGRVRGLSPSATIKKQIIQFDNTFLF